MKNYFILILFSLAFLACNRPAKLLEKGKSEKALHVSIRHLKNGKIKDSDLYAFEKSFLLETEKDAYWIKNTRQYGQSDKWLAIHDKAVKMLNRQKKVQQILYRLNDRGHYPRIDFYPVQELLEESRDKAALYYYAQAQEFIPSARGGNRKAARRAYANLEKIAKYREVFKDTEILRTEMYDLGTTHILLNPVEDEIHFEEDELLFASFFRNRRFPRREQWKVLHLNEPPDGQIDYRLDLRFADIYVSENRENLFVCTNTETIIDAYVDEQVWSEKDSAYVIERKPVYVDISVSVYHYEQEKRASLKLLASLYDIQNETRVQQFVFNGSDSWYNDYSIVVGDRRALGTACLDQQGCKQWFPDDFEILQDAANCTYGAFNRTIKKRID